jgi:hypothetical protein
MVADIKAPDITVIRTADITIMAFITAAIINQQGMAYGDWKHYGNGGYGRRGR